MFQGLVLPHPGGLSSGRGAGRSLAKRRGLAGRAWEFRTGSECGPLCEQFFIESVIIIFLVLRVDGLKLQLDGTFVALESRIVLYSGSGREGNKGNINAFACLMPLRAVNCHPSVPQMCVRRLTPSRSGV